MQLSALFGSCCFLFLDLAVFSFWILLCITENTRPNVRLVQEWADSLGGLKGLIAKSEENLAVIEDFVGAPFLPLSLSCFLLSSLNWFLRAVSCCLCPFQLTYSTRCAAGLGIAYMFDMVCRSRKRLDPLPCQRRSHAFEHICMPDTGLRCVPSHHSLVSVRSVSI